MEGEGYPSAPAAPAPPGGYHDYASPRPPQKRPQDDGNYVEMGRGGAHYVPAAVSAAQRGGGYNPSQDERVRVAALHNELQRLMDDERGLLAHVEGQAERADIKEQFFHQRMSLLAQLPEPERERYQHLAGGASLHRMGTVRRNVDGLSDVVYVPVFVRLVFLANVVVFLVCMHKNEWEFAPKEVNPLYGPDPQVLVDMGAKVGTLIREDGEWWRWFTPIFLHAGVVHLLMNMVVLLRLGASMEEAFGHTRVAVIYLVSGVGGNLASAIFLPDEIGVGASGALFGLIGALFGDFIHNWRHMTEGKCCYFTQLVFSSVVGLAVGLFPLLDNFAHVGGWLVGILAGTVFLAGAIKDHRGKAITYCYTYPAAILCFALVASLLLAGFLVFYDDVDPEGWCSWCHNLSCMETPYWDCDDALGRNTTGSAKVRWG